MPPGVGSASDNFDSGNDAAWVHLDLSSVGQAPSTYSFPPDSSGGRAYRLFAPAPSVTTWGNALAISYRTNVSSDFEVSVDMVAWDNTLYQSFGLLARMTGMTLAQFSCYAFNYSGYAGGEFQINRVINGAVTTLAVAPISLVPTHRYRLRGVGVGTLLMGEIYDLSDLTKPLATVVANDGTYSN